MIVVEKEDLCLIEGSFIYKEEERKSKFVRKMENGVKCFLGRLDLSLDFPFGLGTSNPP